MSTSQGQVFIQVSDVQGVHAEDQQLMLRPLQNKFTHYTS